MVIKGGKIFTVTQGIIDNGYIIIKEGKIQEVGKDLAVPPGARLIEATDDFIFPGFIDAGTNLGTLEFENIEEDDHEAELMVAPHLRIVDAFNPENHLILEVRKKGVTSAIIAPRRGNLLSGQSALLHLYGQNTDEMLIKCPASVHGTLGGVFNARSKPAMTFPSTRMGAAALLRQTLVDAQAYYNQYQKTGEKADSGGSSYKPHGLNEEPVPPFLDALIPVIKRELPLVLIANRYDDIMTALRIAREFNIRLIISEGAEAYRLAPGLAAMSVPVIIRPKSAYRLTVETTKARPENAALLQKAGVKIAFQTGSVHDLDDLLPGVQEAIRYGLSPEDALSALTINAAEIFGVADKVGSIEKDKLADLVIFSGNPLTSVAKVKMVIIKGQTTEIGPL
ncbi:MAG TPA: amidohydrolase family protein [Candidatus Saccharicenans sp.]|nr:amidohydrolase family protein [Candidatus Saccharicenans sp.]